MINSFPRTFLIWISNFLNPLIDIIYRGNKFFDPINGKSYRKFLPYGYVIQRDNALSPGTLSLERHRLLWLYLRNETSFFKKKLKRIQAQQYITSLYSALAELASVNSNKPLNNFVQESQTPGGLNWQGVNELRKAGYYNSMEKSVNNILNTKRN